MKTFATLLLTLASTLAANASFAESFNDRGKDFTTSVKSDSSIQYSVNPVVISSQGFNDRGEDYVATVPAGSNQLRHEVYITSMGFNDRGDVVN